jgi:hypothetical protein
MDKSVVELIEECKKISEYCTRASQECQRAGAARTNVSRKLLLQYPAVIAAALPLAGVALSLFGSFSGIKELSFVANYCGPAVCASFSLLTAIVCIGQLDRDLSGQENLASVLQGLSFRADALARSASRLPAENFAAMVRSLKSEFQGVLDAAGLSGKIESIPLIRNK